MSPNPMKFIGFGGAPGFLPLPAHVLDRESGGGRGMLSMHRDGDMEVRRRLAEQAKYHRVNSGPDPPALCDRDLQCFVRPSRNSARPSSFVIRSSKNSISPSQNVAWAEGPSNILRGSSRIVIRSNTNSIRCRRIHLAE